MHRWKKWTRAVSHPSSALGILEMAANWALLEHNFSIMCLKMSDMRWKARCGTPASIYARHHSLLSFFTRHWIRNQDSNIMYLCADALSLDETGGERETAVKCMKNPSVCDAGKEGSAYIERIHSSMNSNLMFLFNLHWKRCDLGLLWLVSQRMQRICWSTFQVRRNLSLPNWGQLQL